MNDRGLSLVELLVVIAIMGIILSLSTLNFNRMTKKGNAEKDIRGLFSDIQTAQMDSLRKYRRHEITLNADSYVIRRYSSAADDAGTVRLQRSLVKTITSSASVPVILRFSEKSYPSVLDSDGDEIASAVPLAICLTSNDAGAAVDSIIVSEGTINLALKHSGGSCAPANCGLK